MCLFPKRLKYAGFADGIGSCCLLGVIVLSFLSTTPAFVRAEELHAAVTPTQAVFVPGRWETFYATIINDSPNIARSCGVAIGNQGFELQFVTTEKKRNLRIGEFNEPADIFPQTSQSYQLKIRWNAGETRQAENVELTYLCNGIEPARRLPGVNQIEPVADAQSLTQPRVERLARPGTPDVPDYGEQVQARLGCIEENERLLSSAKFCADNKIPTTLSVNRTYSGNFYYFCFENGHGVVESIYMVAETATRVSAHQCKYENPDQGCSIRYKLATAYAGPGFGGGKGGYFCSTGYKLAGPLGKEKTYDWEPSQSARASYEDISFKKR